MRLNPTVALTLILLFLMFGAGFVSAAWGFSLGRKALQEVTQPDIRPNSDAGDRQTGQSRNNAVDFLSEEEILEQVESQKDFDAENDRADASRFDPNSSQSAAC